MKFRSASSLSRLGRWGALLDCRGRDWGRCRRRGYRLDLGRSAGGGWTRYFDLGFLRRRGWRRGWGVGAGLDRLDLANCKRVSVALWAKYQSLDSGIRWWDTLWSGTSIKSTVSGEEARSKKLSDSRTLAIRCVSEDFIFNRTLS